MKYGYKRNVTSVGKNIYKLLGFLKCSETPSSISSLWILFLLILTDVIYYGEGGGGGTIEYNILQQ